jgi:hypothetical protein
MEQIFYSHFQLKFANIYSTKWQCSIKFLMVIDPEILMCLWSVIQFLDSASAMCVQRAFILEIYSI